MNCKYVQRTSKKRRQALLDQVLQEEMEKLRKMCFPYQRRNFLNMPVEIREDKLDKNIAGTWDKEEIGKYKYKHIIKINNLTVYSVQKMPTSWLRKDYLKDLRETVKHELIHGLCFERYEDMFQLKEVKHDASPIFLTVLYWTLGKSNHECAEKFKKTQMYKNTFNFGTFAKLDDYIINMLAKYREATRDLLEISNKEDYVSKKTKELNVIINSFEFAARECGFQKRIEFNYTDIIKNYKNTIKNNCIARTWTIGCNVKPEQIVELYNRKQDCKAQYYDNKKILNVLTEDKQVKQITIREEKNI